jgi:hypothetical protein
VLETRKRYYWYKILKLQQSKKPMVLNRRIIIQNRNKW